MTPRMRDLHRSILKSGLIAACSAVIEIQHDGETARVWSGEELLRLADAVAGAVRAALSAAEPGCPRLVALFISNSATYVACLLACIKLGATFMPLDPRWPSAALQHVVQHAGPAAVVWSTALSGAHGEPPITGVPLVELDAWVQRSVASAVAHEPELAALDAQAEHASPPPLYLLYTSGSTGAPLGVCGTQEGLLNRVEWMQAAFPLRASDVVAFKTAPCFVDSLWEIFHPLLAGAAVLAVPLRVASNPLRLLRALGRHGATHLTAVPSLWASMLPLLEGDPGLAAALSSLRQVAASGEPLPAALLRRLRAALPGRTVLNLYGSTEVAADATCMDCTNWEPGSEEEAVPVGRPISHVVVAIAAAVAGRSDDAVQLLPPGELGEVLIGGAALATGYWRNPAATEARFISVPEEALLAAGVLAPGAPDRAPPLQAAPDITMRLFRTGDLGRVDAEGVLHLAGRLDLQVKVNGVRVDLLEVEAALAAHHAVRAAAAKAWTLPNGLSTLVAYYEVEEAAAGAGSKRGRSEVDTLRLWCLERLPPAAVPSQMIALPQLPRGPAGKLLRSALPPPPGGLAAPPGSNAAHPAADAAGAAPPAQRQRLAAPTEVQVSIIFAEALGHASFEPTTDLFAAGGSSLAAAAIAARLGMEPEAVLQHPTVRSLTAHLQRKSLNAAEAAVAASSPGPAPQLYPLRALLPAVAGGKAPAAGLLRMVWRTKLGLCVDAPPLAAAGSVFACSHAGDVVCLEPHTGRTRWSVTLPGRADAGMAVCAVPLQLPGAGDSYLAVAINEGALHFLQCASGEPGDPGVIVTGGGIRATPVVDPWAGLVWVASHAQQLLVVAVPGVCVASFSCPAAVSAPVSFDPGRHIAYCACLNGDLLALTPPTWTAAPGSMSRAPVEIELAWRQHCGAAIFVAPTVLPSGGATATSEAAVVVAAATGVLTALSAGGVVMWRCNLNVGIFSALVTINDANEAHGGACLIAGTADGQLLCVDASQGVQRPQRVHLSPSRITGLVQARHGGHALLCAAAANGGLFVVDPGALLAGKDAVGAVVLDAVRLPSDVFALAQGPGQSGVLVGCRDEHAYCLQLAT